MSSLRRLISSRANAALSTGPRTAAGKRRSSQNAFRHGCRSRRHVIPEMVSLPGFDDLLQDFLSCLKPRNPAERLCVERMAASRWRLSMLRATETRMLNEAIALQSPDSGDASTRLADAFLSLLLVPGFLVLSRYAVTEDRNYYRAHQQLLDLRRASPQAPAPLDAAGNTKIFTNKPTLDIPYASGEHQDPHKIPATRPKQRRRCRASPRKAHL